MQPSLRWWETQGAEITAFTSSETRADSTCLGWTPRADVHSRVEVGGYGQNRTALTLWAMASSCCSAHSCCWALSSALYSASLGSSCSQRLRAFCTAVSTYRRWQERGIARVKLQKLWPHTCFTLCLPALQPHWFHTKQETAILLSKFISCPLQRGSGTLHLMSNAAIRSVIQSTINHFQQSSIYPGRKTTKGSPSATCQSLYSPPPSSCSTNTPYEYIHRHASCKHRLLLSSMNLDIRMHMTLQVQTRTQGVMSFTGEGW